MPDFVTCLATYGPNLTKVFNSRGGVDSYDDAASFQAAEIQVSDIHGLSRLLTKLETKHQKCIIRGKLTAGTPEPGKVAGSLARTNANFDDCPHHWFMVDIDKYQPDFGDPVLEAEEVILDYIVTGLPDSFKGCSFHWQLSSSAGLPTNKHLLKAHVWFWSETAYTSAQMYEWAKGIGPRIDKAVYRRVQVHYTANPIFEEGRDDPVPVRSGFYQGTRDTVPLKLTSDIIEHARATGSGSGGNDMKLVDPSEKDNAVGAFHNAFDAPRVLLEFLEGEFEQVSERRYTWLNGGGTPEGVWVHDDGMHVGATHNTWPLPSIVNLFDLVRHFRFGHLDIVKTGDDFDQMNMDTAPMQAKPSYKETIEFAKRYEEYRRAMLAIARKKEEGAARARLTAVEQYRRDIANADSEFALRDQICVAISEDTTLDAGTLDNLIEVVMQRFRTLGVVQSKAGVRRMLTSRRRVEVDVDTGRPTWLKDWYYVTDVDKFYRYDTEDWLTQQGFNARYNRHIPPGDNRPTAYTLALETFNLPVVRRALYWPGGDKKPAHEGGYVINTYRPSSVPDAAEVETGPGKTAVELIKAHINLLANNRPEVATAIIDFLAYCVQNPGKKIRYAILLKGVEGDGKSLLGSLMGHVMGQANVKMISPKAVASDFNGWSEGSCLGVLEEIRLVGHNRHDILNAVKPCITNDVIPIHRKGKDEYNCPNMTNYIAFTNHSDALPLEDTDRRWLIIFTPWNSMEEMAARLTVPVSKYFDAIHAALKDCAPYLRRWLLEWEVSPTFNPNGRAPDTLEKQTMISLGVSDEETMARDLIARGITGVSEKVISTSELTQALAAEGLPMLIGRRVTALMLKLGYTRVEKPIKWTGFDNRTRRVWVKGSVPDLPSLHRLLDETISLGSEFED